MRFVNRFRRRLFGEPPSACRYEVLRRIPQHSIGAEIGVYRGDFSAQILKYVRPKRLHLIDPWHYETDPAYSRTWYGGKIGVDQVHMDAVYESVVRRFRSEIDAGIVVIHRAPSSDALRSFPPKYFDWLYIDGNHQYEFVRQDLELGLAVTKPTGLLCGDDYHLNGWCGDGVVRAVDEMRSICNTRLILDGQFMLEKTASQA
jgi:hypothetical protein